MIEEQDPALSQEGVGDDATTVTDQPVTEGAAESTERSGESAGAPQDDKNDESEQVEIVMAGEEPPPEPKEGAAPWVKELRKKYRDAEARAAELERKLMAHGQPAQAAEPGPKPTLEACDFDANAYEKKLEGWHEAKRQKDATDAQMAQQAEANRRAWQSRLDLYAKGKDELSKKIPEYSDAETAVNSALNVVQQGVLLQGADNAALVVCALGQRPKLLEEFAKETDPVRFAFKLAKLEANLKTKPKSQVPLPEKPVNGSGAVSGGDSREKELEAKADKSGDRTELNAYRRSKRKS